MDCTTTVYAVMLDRAERGMADLLIQVADYFYCKGAGLISAPSDTIGMADLLATLDQRYEAEVKAARNWAEVPLGREMPIWLRAAAERAVLETEPPAASWSTAPIGGAK